MNSNVAEVIIRFGDSRPTSQLFPTVIPDASGFAVSNPFAFVLACSLDRGASANVIWTIPYDLNVRLGHLDPCRLSLMSLAELNALIASLPRKPRYTNDAPLTIHQLSQMVCDEYGGDAASIWTARSAAEVKKAFMRLHGVGPGIANMVVLLIEKAFHVRFPDIDRPGMDIKPDVHTMRVLYRLGVSSKQTEPEAIAAARRLNPSFPGALDGALWLVGREYCLPQNPKCNSCPLAEVCSRVGVAAP